MDQRDSCRHCNLSGEILMLRFKITGTVTIIACPNCSMVTSCGEDPSAHFGSDDTKSRKFIPLRPLLERLKSKFD
jgi:hypothetical protein